MQSGIKLIADSSLDPNDMVALSEAFTDQYYTKGEKIFEKGQSTRAALYLVRKGQVKLKGGPDGSRVIERGGYFGEDMLKADQEKLHGKGDPVIAAAYSAKVLEDCTLGVLTLADARTIIDTTKLGVRNEKPDEPSADINVKDFEKHRILGAGTFGQVWLVSHIGKDKKKHAYALKIQSKYDLIQNNQAKGVVNEKNIMAKLDHPFIIKMVATDQDPQRVYMVMELVQGGELYSVLHTPKRDGVSENDAKFYAAGILEGLTYMHNKHGMSRLRCSYTVSVLFFYPHIALDMLLQLFTVISSQRMFSSMHKDTPLLLIWDSVSILVSSGRYLYCYWILT